MGRVLPKQRCEGPKHTVHCIRDLTSPSAINAIVCTASSASGGGCEEGPFSCTGMTLGGVRTEGQVVGLVDKSPGISSLSGLTGWLLPPAQYPMQP